MHLNTTSDTTMRLPNKRILSGFLNCCL